MKENYGIDSYETDVLENEDNFVTEVVLPQDIKAKIHIFAQAKTYEERVHQQISFFENPLENERISPIRYSNPKELIIDPSDIERDLFILDICEYFIKKHRDSNILNNQENENLSNFYILAVLEELLKWRWKNKYQVRTQINSSKKNLWIRIENKKEDLFESKNKLVETFRNTLLSVKNNLISVIG